jgi:quercetin dioxygenase-like cupin family protein
MSPGRTVSHKLMSEHTGDAISIFEEIVPVGEGTPLHIHHTSDEVIHLIEGQLLMKLEDRTTTLLPGARVFIPRGTPHAWRNNGTGPARASYIFNPSDGAKLFEEWRLLGPMRPAIMGKVMALMKRYGYQLVALTWE